MIKVYLLVAILAIAARLLFVFLFPGSGGDWDIYSTVAENILNGCGVSLSDPLTLECVPHFGGNQLPGYPAFVALLWGLFDHKDTAVRLAQVFIYVLSLLWLVRAVYVYTFSKRIALMVGIVMAISPLQIAWPRYTQTETLALASTIIVLAELLYSLAYKRLRIFPLALALSFAIFVRLDSVLLTIPTAITGFIIYKPYKALKKGLVLLLLLLIPLGSWTARNVHVDIPLFPQNMTLPEGSHQPTGYLKWGWTWITEEYQRPGWGWGVNRHNYDSISIDSSAYDSIEEKDRVDALLNSLQDYNGQPFPLDIDREFSEIADERLKNYKFRTLVIIPFKRSMALWSNLFSSYAWPNELPSSISHEDRLQVKRGSGIIDLAFQYPFIALTKGITGGYKILLQILFILIVIFTLKANIGNNKLRNIMLISGSIVLSRTVFFAATNNIETRYSVEAVPGMELLAVVGIIFFIKIYREKI